MLRKSAIALAIIALAVTQLCVLTAQSADARTIFVLKSQPGDWVGGGTKGQNLTTANGRFNFRTYQNSVFVEYRGAHWFDMHLRPPAGEALTAGMYEGTQRAGPLSPTKPGLDFSYDGRGCNTATGRFLISEISFDGSGNVEKLAVDFEQHCDDEKPALYGSFRHNSNVSIEPRLSVGAATALKGNAGTSNATVIASLSMPSTSRVVARIRTGNDSAVNGTDYHATSGRIVFPPGVTVVPITIPIIGDRTARGDGTFTVSITSETPIGEGTAQVRILDPNVPQSVLTLNSQKGSFVGNDEVTGDGMAWLFTTADTSIKASRNINGGVSVTLGLPHRWHVDMTGPDKAVLAAGKYDNVSRFPFEPAATPGLSVGGSGRGCNTLIGQFVINEVQYAGNGSVDSFAADFEQRCHLYGGGPLLPGTLFGSVWVNAIPQQASVTNAVIAGSTAEFTVTLNPASARREMVRFATRDGSALAGVDYNPVSMNLTFAPGEIQKTVQVPLLAGGQAGKQFFGELSSFRTPLWIRTGTATAE